MPRQRRLPPPPVLAARSGIDGIGAFARVRLPARRKIGEMDGERISVRTARRRAQRSARLHLVELDRRHAIDGTHGASPLKYVNHSCAPNVFTRIAHGRLEFYALRTIRRGEELCADYGATHHDGRLRCRCGAPGCRGFL